MFKKKQQDKELLDGKIFSGELSEIGVKSQEEQNNVMKGFEKDHDTYSISTTCGCRCVYLIPNRN